MRRKLFPRVSPLLAGLIAGTASTASADIYTYTDADGVVHFSSKPTPGAQVYLKTPQRRAKAGVVPVMPSDTSMERFTRYDDTIQHAAILYQIPVELVRAVIKVESDYDPRAVSPAGARGLMQMIPATAERMQVRDIFDPR
ncbi:MAG: transglycosylase SLT domain-containing protein, partial [Polyangiaceae bacterium]|nr:transglycosylase SLT domain-containing protein [Polyangiaceae bacterium]